MHVHLFRGVNIFLHLWNSDLSLISNLKTDFNWDLSSSHWVITIHLSAQKLVYRYIWIMGINATGTCLFFKLPVTQNFEKQLIVEITDAAFGSFPVVPPPFWFFFWNPIYQSLFEMASMLLTALKCFSVKIFFTKLLMSKQFSKQFCVVVLRRGGWENGKEPIFP